MGTYELSLTLTAEGIDGYQALLDFVKSSQWKRWKEKRGIKYLDHSIYIHVTYV